MNNINLDNDEPECRICFDDVQDDELISPCRCNGTSKWVHRGCLNRWREFNRGRDGERQCMECKEDYIVRRKYPYEKKNLFRNHMCTFTILNYLLSSLISIIWLMAALAGNDRSSWLLYILNNGNPEPREEECEYSYQIHNITCRQSRTMAEYIAIPSQSYTYVIFHGYFLLTMHTILYTIYYYWIICKKIKRVKRYMFLNKGPLIFWNIYCLRFFLLYYISSRIFFEPSIFFGLCHVNIFLEPGCLYSFTRKHDDIINYMNFGDNDEEILNWHINPTAHLEFTELEIPPRLGNISDESYEEVDYSSEED